MKVDIHNYQHKLEVAVAKVKRSSVSERNRQHILQFRDFCTADGSIGIARTERYMGVLLYWASLLDKDFELATKDDIMKAVRNLQETNYSPSTKATYKAMLKRFYKWLKNSKNHPEEVEWISSKVKLTEKTLPSEGELLNENDISKLIKVAKYPRDKALVATLYESGARIGELASLQIKNVVFDEHGVVLSLQGKTGQRRIRIIAATSALATYLESHPNSDNPTAPLWVSIGRKSHGHRMGYVAIYILLRRLLKDAGIQKRANPHIFRHSRATFLANHLTEFQMNQYFGWIQGSDMPATYVHMSGKSLDSSILALNGMKAPENAKEALFKAQRCQRCSHINSPDAKYCSKCAGILSVQAAMELESQAKQQREARSQIDEVMNKLVQDKEFLEMFMRKVKTLKSLA